MKIYFSSNYNLNLYYYFYNKIKNEYKTIQLFHNKKFFR